MNLPGYDAWKLASPHDEQPREAHDDYVGALARDGFIALDAIAERWLFDPRRRDSLLWLVGTALGGDTAEFGRARDSIADDFVFDCADDYAEAAREKLADLEEREQ